MKNMFVRESIRYPQFELVMFIKIFWDGVIGFH